MRFLSEFLTEIKIVVFMALIIIPGAIVLSPILLLAFIIREIITILAKCFRSDLIGLVKREQALLACENSNKAVINTIAKTISEGDINLDQFREDFQNRVLTAQENNEFIYEGLHNTWTSFLGYAFWKKDPTFDLKNHIREYDYTGTLQIPPRPDETDVNKILVDLVSAPWNRNRSPWEILKVSNYQLNGESHTLILIRFDHMLCDGFSILEIFRRVYQSPMEIPKVRLGKKPTSSFSRLFLLLKLPYDLSKNVLVTFSGSKFLHSKMSTKESILSWSPAVDVETIKTIKNHFNVNFAAVIYSAIFGGIQKCLEESGQEVPEKLTSGFVVPLPNHPGGLSFNASLAASEWQLKSTLPQERLLKIQTNFESISRSTAFLLLGRLPAYFPMAVRKILIELFFRLGISILVTSFPATTSPDYYRGHKMVEMTVCVHTRLSIALIVTSVGLNNTLKMNCCINKSLFASEDAATNFGSYAHEEFDALLKATVYIF